jgi:hypothetical protein
VLKFIVFSVLLFLAFNVPQVRAENAEKIKKVVSTLYNRILVFSNKNTFLENGEEKTENTKKQINIAKRLVKLSTRSSDAAAAIILLARNNILTEKVRRSVYESVMEMWINPQRDYEDYHTGYSMLIALLAQRISPLDSVVKDIQTEINEAARSKVSEKTWAIERALAEEVNYYRSGITQVFFVALREFIGNNQGFGPDLLKAIEQIVESEPKMLLSFKKYNWKHPELLEVLQKSFLLIAKNTENQDLFRQCLNMLSDFEVPSIETVHYFIKLSKGIPETDLREWVKEALARMLNVMSKTSSCNAEHVAALLLEPEADLSQMN